MDERYRFTVEQQHEGMRLDSYLAEQSGKSRSNIANAIENGLVTLNDKTVKANRRVKQGETYQLIVPAAVETDIIAQDIPLNIIYEDDDIAIINKARHMAVHPSPGIADGTLVNALLFHLSSLSGINGQIRPGIVHRLDKDTTGLLAVAKNDLAHHSLADQLKDRTLKRTYLAIVHGNIKEDEGIVDAPIMRAPKDRKRMAVVNGGRDAITHWRVLERYGDATLVECQLETGRTHQIRVHMAHIGHPVYQDPVYGTKKERGNEKGQMLHAHKLGLIHPTTKQRMEWQADPPEDFIAIQKGFAKND